MRFYGGMPQPMIPQETEVHVTLRNFSEYSRKFPLRFSFFNVYKVHEGFPADFIIGSFSVSTQLIWIIAIILCLSVCESVFKNAIIRVSIKVFIKYYQDTPKQSENYENQVNAEEEPENFRHVQ